MSDPFQIFLDWLTYASDGKPKPKTGPDTREFHEKHWGKITAVLATVALCGWVLSEMDRQRKPELPDIKR